MASVVRRKAPSKRVLLLAATRKGAWIFSSDAARRSWRCDGPHFLGHIVHHLVLDPRDGRTLLAATSTGHLGPTLFRSTDLGRRWSESTRPPAFPKAAEGQAARAVGHTFWLTPGHASQPGVWYAGTSPTDLFRSRGWRRHLATVPRLSTTTRNTASGWAGRRTARRTAPSCIRSSSIRATRNHLYLGMSSGGVHESLDGGRSWAPLIDGLEVVESFDASKVWFHDPHCVRLCPSNPDRLYQQNHCGIYRLDRPSRRWVRVGRNMPKRVGDIGFPMVVHPRTPTRPGYFRWTVRPSGRASPSAGGRPPMSRTTAVAGGSARIAGCRASRPGGP